MNIDAEQDNKQQKAALNTLLHQLAQNTSWEIRNIAATNPDCPTELLETLALDPESYTRRAVAQNRSCPPNILHQLSLDPESTIQQIALTNPNCSQNTIQNHPNKNAKHWQRALALNTATSPETLHQVPTNPNCSDQLKLLIAQNIATLPKTLNIIAQTQNPDILVALLRNPKTTAETLHRIRIQHPDKLVPSYLQRLLAAHPNYTTITEEEINSGQAGIWTQTGWLANPSCPTQTLHEAILGHTWTHKLVVASNPKTTTETLHQIIKQIPQDPETLDIYWEVAQAVTIHPNTNPQKALMLHLKLLKENFAGPLMVEQPETLINETLTLLQNNTTLPEADTRQTDVLLETAMTSANIHSTQQDPELQQLLENLFDYTTTLKPWTTAQKLVFQKNRVEKSWKLTIKNTGHSPELKTVTKNKKTTNITII